MHNFDLSNLTTPLFHPLGRLDLLSHGPSLPCANIVNGRYKYTDELLQLASVSSPPSYQAWPRYQTPIRVEELHQYLASHPDQRFAAYIHDGLSMGFRIGFDYRRSTLDTRFTNHPSAQKNTSVVRDKIHAEVRAGRLHGPLPQVLKQVIHVSPLGLVPKQHQRNKWRLIMDLSSPRGGSVNDGIDQNLCSLRYASVDEAVNIIKQLGRDTEMVKVDIKDAYRIIPVHPADYHLLGLLWDDKLYFDRALPFGLRSAPKLFNAVADFIAWILINRGVKYLLHYLDDFLLLGTPGSQEGALFLAILLAVFEALDIPVAAQKTEGPATAITFLGILIDSHTFELRLPAEKLARLQELLVSWSLKKYCTRKELESLLGQL